MLKHWPRVLLILLLAAEIVRAQTGAVITPSDDRKEPKTLSKATGTAPVRPVANTLDEETGYRAETNYRPDLAAPLVVAPLQSVAIDQAVGGVKVRGTLVRPAKEAPKAAVLILPEWWGLTPPVKREAEWWARQGFTALALDLYGGKVAATRGEAAQLMGQLKPEQVMTELKAALALLAKPAGGTTTQTLKIGVLGFGIGAVYAQRLAAEDPRPEALILFYGEPLKDAAELKKIAAPILAIYAGRDAWITPEKIAAFKKALTGARLPAETYTFMTLPGFMFNDGDSTDRGYADTAHQKALVFFSRELEE